MKRIALLLVMVILLSMALSSCQVIWMVIEPKDADELWERIDKTMEGLKSCTGEAKLKMSFSYEGFDFDAEGEMKNVTIGNEDDNYYYYYSSDSFKVSVDGETLEETEELLAYDAGVMYVHKNSGDDTVAICSPIDAKAFCDYKADDDSEFDISPEGAGVKTMVRYDGKKWELSYSSFEKEKFDEMLEDLSLDSMMEEMNIEISDISVIIKTDEKYRVEEMLVEYLSDDYDEPVISLDLFYSDFNSAKKVSFSKSQYKEVADARIVEWVDEHLSDAIDEEEGEFSLYINQTIKQGSTVLDSYVENDDVTYKNINGGKSFTYNIKASVNGQSATISYAGGTQSVNVSGQIQNAPQTQSAAREFIESLMNSAKYDPVLVKDVTNVKSNRYKITMNPADADAYEQMMISIGDIYRSSTVYIEVVMDGDDVERIETYIEINGEKYTYIIESDVVFDKS